MSVVMSMHWPEVTPEQYDTVRDAVDWEGVPAAGGQIHVAWFDDEGFHVTDVWESQQAFETFFAERLAPVIEKAGLPGTPHTTFSPLHRRFVAPEINGAA
ncbi:hypothetical protein [Streptomyces akebiae]|uniref:ABM domain-containing protein n=1 Tax=Streptomyces akebiae TaxID=2865673 RepID=A0ABX8XTC3_9ACTN|nr:hypothetical protein [Streptomyces akebiae]QYX79171.1 hypothetical protein K1J60_24000 [Streptomyces akebiae]